MKLYFGKLLMPFFSILSLTCKSENSIVDTVILENERIQLIQSLKGGAISAIRLKGNSLNPLDWSLPVCDQPDINKDGFPFQGHFISLGTWGMPTKGEQEAGIRLYGEATAQFWKIEKSAQDSLGYKSCSVGFESKIEGLSLIRSIILSKEAPLVKVEEKVTNDLPISRAYNFLQHPTFGGEFVSDKLLIDTNAGQGFYQKGSYPRVSYDSLEVNSFQWPNGIFPNGEIDLRTSGYGKKTYLTSHVFSEGISLGWVTAANPGKKLLVGYIWDAEEYPWLNVWHQAKNGKVIGRAIEFATCGLGLSFKELILNDYTYFGRNSFEFIDAKQEISKTYYMFIIEIPEDFLRTISMQANDNEIVLKYDTHKGERKRIFPKL